MSNSQARKPRSRIVRIPISWKLLAATIVVGAVATGIAIYGLRRMHALNERLTNLVDYSSEKVKSAALLKQDLVTITRAEKNLILARSVEEMQRYAATIDDTLAAMGQHQERLTDLANNNDRRQLNTFAQGWQEWQKIHHEVRNFAQLNSNVRARQLALGKGRETYELWEGALTALASKITTESQVARAQNDSQHLAALVHKMTLVGQLLADTARIQRAEKQLILADSESELVQSEKAFAPLEEQIKTHIDALHKLSDEAEKQVLSQAEDAFKTYAQVLAEIRAVLGQKGNIVVYQLAYEIGGPIAAKCERLLDAIIAQNEMDLQVARSESQGTYIASRNALLAVSAVGIVISVTVTYLTGQHLANNLSRLTDYTREVEDTGDLSKPVPRVSTDEVGLLADSFDHLRESLHRQTSERAALNQALEHKNKEMEQFVYTVSHDLSSPLVSCKGLVGLIREDIASGNYEEVLASAKRLDGAVDQLRRIIEDLLTLSRIGRKPLELVDVDVEGLVVKLKEELAGRLQEVQAELRVETPLPPVVADATDLTRVFENILTNAIKYACDGQHSVITVGGTSTDGEVRYFVRDSGPGIDAKYHERIFGLFQRLDSERPGTGVGLASVAKIMRMHGGRSWVESTPGQGATFWIAFPKRLSA